VTRSTGAVQATAIEKRYGDVLALRGVDLVVAAGEFLTLLGPSGSGKTTLLNVIAGFQAPDVGEVWVDDRPVTNLPAHARGFGMVFQSYALFPHMTVAENVAYPLRMRGVGRQERNERVLEYLQLVELGELPDRYPDQLSGGQQQRVALARALVFKPSVLLMDEPLGALDRRLRQALQFAIKRLHQELEATIVYVTHDQEEALAMSDRIVVMHDGLVEQVGSPRAVYEHPRTAFVASFLGETNLLHVEVLGPDGEGSRVRHLESGQEFCIGDALKPGAVTLSIRPENVRLGRPSDACALQGRAVTISFMGDAWRCEVRIGDGMVIARQPVHEGMPVGEGDRTSIGVLAGGIRLMPSQEEN
jgi:putative spermidine/putrescine transport system ATP-binding protein